MSIEQEIANQTSKLPMKIAIGIFLLGGVATSIYLITKSVKTAKSSKQAAAAALAAKTEKELQDVKLLKEKADADAALAKQKVELAKKNADKEAENKAARELVEKEEERAALMERFANAKRLAAKAVAMQLETEEAERAIRQKAEAAAKQAAEAAAAAAAPTTPTISTNRNAFQCTTGMLKSMPTLPLALRINAAGDVECLSLDGKNCVTSNCAQALTTPEGDIHPLVCGEAHKLAWGGPTGYDTPGHWCESFRNLNT